VKGIAQEAGNHVVPGGHPSPTLHADRVQGGFQEEGPSRGLQVQGHPLQVGPLLLVGDPQAKAVEVALSLSKPEGPRFHKLGAEEAHVVGGVGALKDRSHPRPGLAPGDGGLQVRRGGLGPEVGHLQDHLPPRAHPAQPGVPGALLAQLPGGRPVLGPHLGKAQGEGPLQGIGLEAGQEAHEERPHEEDPEGEEEAVGPGHSGPAPSGRFLGAHVHPLSLTPKRRWRRTTRRVRPARKRAAAEARPTRGAAPEGKTLP
jgi:hypothetical protein